MFRKITINWSYPMDYERILADQRMGDIGIYYITKTFGGKISDLYIGKTTDAFGHRLESHWWEWLNQYRGAKQVRLGTIVSPQRLSDEERKALINDAEMTLIFLQRTLIKNKQCRQSCNPANRLRITNTGYRGNLAAEMFIPDEEWFL